jgi:hypothetical protein
MIETIAATTTSRPRPLSTPRAGRSRGAAGYAIVQDWSGTSCYILDTATDEYQGPYATRHEAELTIVGWLTAPR